MHQLHPSYFVEVIPKTGGYFLRNSRAKRGWIRSIFCQDELQSLFPDGYIIGFRSSLDECFTQLLVGGDAGVLVVGAMVIG